MTHIIKAWLVALAVAGAFTLWGVVMATPARAGGAWSEAPVLGGRGFATSVSAGCWAHLAGKKTHTTPAADRRFHLERGEPSPCSESDAGEQRHEQRSERKQDRDRRHIDKPGYHCRWVVLRCG